MKAIAIIAEYNPFHAGHAYQIQQLRNTYPNTTIIAIMSGPFTQRGVPSFIDKWTKTKMALPSVDIVIELPYKFATGAADTFATGGVTIANAIGAEALSFGSEEGEIATIQEYANQWVHFEQSIIKKAKAMKNLSYIEALYKTAETLIGSPPFDYKQPNNILAFAYAKANAPYQMKLLTHQRVGASYHSKKGDRIFASASGIRAFIQNKHTLPPYLPEKTTSLLSSYEGRWGSMELLYPLLRAELLRTPSEELASFFEVAEGIERRFVQAAYQANSFSEWMQQVQVKHWTRARIQRAATHIVTHFTKKMYDASPSPTYLRLLGATSRGKQYLKEEQHRFTHPIIYSPKQCLDDPLMQADVRAQTIYTLLTNTQGKSRTIQRDYSVPPIFLS